MCDKSGKATVDDHSASRMRHKKYLAQSGLIRLRHPGNVRNCRFQQFFSAGQRIYEMGKLKPFFERLKPVLKNSVGKYLLNQPRFRNLWIEFLCLFHSSINEAI